MAAACHAIAARRRVSPALEQASAGDTPAATVKANKNRTARVRAFTILELLIVTSIILVLAGLILGTSGYVQKKGARSRAEAEIAGMSAALDNYKTDNGQYPTSSASDALLPTNADPSSTAYRNASLFLYKALSGDHDANRKVTSADSAIGPDGNPVSPAPTGLPKTYFPFKPQMLTLPSTDPVRSLRDPFGNSYGYSTTKASNPTGTTGYNPTFDLWCTANAKPANDQNQWIKNW